MFSGLSFRPETLFSIDRGLWTMALSNGLLMMLHPCCLEIVPGENALPGFQLLQYVPPVRRETSLQRTALPCLFSASAESSASIPPAALRIPDAVHRYP